MSEEVEGSRESLLKVLEAVLGHSFRDPNLLRAALQHSSFAHEHEGMESNERLEFLGDAVVGLAVGHLLYEAHPDWAEGDLTRGLHALVDKRSLSSLGRRLELGAAIQLGRTERQSNGETKASILADAIEAVLGAVYLDGGLAPVTAFLRDEFATALAEGAPRVERDPKTHLQERLMECFGEFPRYELVGDNGIEGHEERFSVEVFVQDERWGSGTGRSKRLAERAAAEEAMPRALATEKAQ